MPVTNLLLLAGLLWADTGAALREYSQGHLRAAREALGPNPGDPEAQAVLALVSAGEGDCTRQRAVLDATFHGVLSAEVRRQAGLAAVQCAIVRDDAASAVPLLAELKRTYPDDADVLYLGAKLYMKGWNSEVAAMFAKTPASYRVNQLSGEIFETQGSFNEAAAEYAKAIAKNPKAINLHFRRGRVLLLASHEPAVLEQARQEFEAELTLNAEDAAALYQIGQIHEAQGQHAEAMKRFEQAAHLRPDFAEALIALAKSKVREGQGEEGIALFIRAIALQPANETAHYNLMLAYTKAGRPQEAAKEKATLDQLQRPPGGEFSDFLKKLGEKPVRP